MLHVCPEKPRDREWWLSHFLLQKKERGPQNLGTRIPNLLCDCG